MRTFMAFVGVGAITSLAAAAPPLPVYSGQLRTADDSAAVVDGTYDLVFSVYEAADANLLGGTLVFEQTFNTVSVSAGYFQVLLDANEIGAAPPLSELYATLSDGAKLFLRITVDDEVLDPPQLLGSVPWADRTGGGTFEPGNGLTANGELLDVDYTLTQARIDTTCAAGQAMMGVDLDGSVLCEPTTVANVIAQGGAGVTVDATASATAKTVMQGTITLPAPGVVIVTATADVFFNNGDAANRDAQVALHACTAADVSDFSDPSLCEASFLTLAFDIDPATAPPRINPTLIVTMPFGTAGTKTIYINAYTNTGDILAVFRGRAVLQWVPALTP